MKLRWFLFDFIPADIDVDPQTRRAVRRAVSKSSALLWSKEGFVRTAFVAPILVALFAVCWHFTQLSLAGSPILLGIGQAILAIGAYLTGVIAYAPLRARQTYLELHRRGFPICASCGYSLRELSSHSMHCPECGVPIDRHFEDPTATPPSRHLDPDGTLPPSGFDQWSRSDPS